MFDTHKLTIIPVDGTVNTDNWNETGLDLSSCNIPNNVHALQWNNPLWPDKNNSHLNGLSYGQGQGWIEIRSTDPNIDITELPQWAISVYELAKQVHENKILNGEV
jgi:hypothetical protein